MRLAPVFVILLLVAPAVGFSVTPAQVDLLEETNIANAYRAFGALGDAVISAQGYTWIVWYTADARPATYISERSPGGEWSPPVFLGFSFDDHGHPDIVVDPEGYLHVVFGGHASEEFPMRYVRSLRPYDASAWEEPRVLTELRFSSYPQIAIHDDGQIVILYRTKGSVAGNMVMRRVIDGELTEPINLVDVPGHGVWPCDMRFAENGDLHVTFALRKAETDEKPERPWRSVHHIVLPAGNIGADLVRDPAAAREVGVPVGLITRLGPFAAPLLDMLDLRDRVWRSMDGTPMVVPWQDLSSTVIVDGPAFAWDPHPALISTDPVGLAFTRTNHEEDEPMEEGLYVATWAGEWAVRREASAIGVFSATEVDGVWIIGGQAPGDQWTAALYFSHDHGTTWQAEALAHADGPIVGLYFEDGAGRVGPAAGPDRPLTGVIIGEAPQHLGSPVWYFERTLDP